MERKQIKDYEGLYEISNIGLVRCLDRYVNHGRHGGGYKKLMKGKIMKLSTNKQGYLEIQLCKYGEYKHLRVHRLVAQAFILNPENKPCINHIDGNKLNNNIENLERCTYSENTQHSINILGNKLGPIGWMSERNHNSKKVLQYTKSNTLIKEWNCMADIKRELGWHFQSISEVCNGKRKSAYGCFWKFVIE